MGSRSGSIISVIRPRARSSRTSSGSPACESRSAFRRGSSSSFGLHVAGVDAAVRIENLFEEGLTLGEALQPDAPSFAGDEDDLRRLAARVRREQRLHAVADHAPDEDPAPLTGG